MHWDKQRFFAESSDWLHILKSNQDLETIRENLLQYLNEVELNNDLSLDDGKHILERIIERDCSRTLRSILDPRNEQAVEFSVLQALVDTANGISRPDLSPAFFADISHVFQGIQRRISLEIDDHSSNGLVGRELARLRSDQLDVMGALVDERCLRYPDGLGTKERQRREKRRNSILRLLGASETNWNDWRWQIRHIARNSKQLAAIANISPTEKELIDKAKVEKMPFGITPYYASLFDDEQGSGRDSAIRAQVIPPKDYLMALESHEIIDDYMKEGDTSPIDLITRRYAEIVILKPYNACPQICVYCQRNWEIDEPVAKGALADAAQIDAAIDWIKDHPAIHDVLITGGDPMVMSDARLKSILDKVSAIPHINRIRIGTRMLVTLPMRFTQDIVRLLGAYREPGVREVCVMTHVEHSYELTPEVVKAVDLLRRQGIGVYNQLVYTFFVSRRFEAVALRRALRRCGIDPYYTFNTKGKAETVAYRVPIARLVQEQKEEARLLAGLSRTDEAVFNVPGLGKNHLRAWQHRDIVSIMPDGSRAYEFHPWEKKIASQQTYIFSDVPILNYLKRLEAIGEDIREYDGIWYYF